MMFNTNDIADYYNQTLEHYAIWWKLSEAQSLHYGIWEDNTKSFKESLMNTNKTFALLAGIRAEHTVLDAGCGVGGAAFYLAKNIGCPVKGITLSEKQIAFANEQCKKLNVEHLVSFDKQDFSKTNFANNSFDIVWACESICYANPKSSFVNELHRILKPGGKLIMSDYFLTPDGKKDKDNYIKNWGDAWAINEFNTFENLIDEFKFKGFTIEQNMDVTKKIFPSSKRMYYACLLGAMPSVLYNLTHPTSRFARTHYLSGMYQYKALKNKLWNYHIILASKN